MDVKQRDATKDSATDGSANVTFFNLSVVSSVLPDMGDRC
jgi:hypothetical protein